MKIEKIKSELELIENRFNNKINYSLFKINNLKKTNPQQKTSNDFKYCSSKKHNTDYLIVKSLHKPIHVPFLNINNDEE